MNDDASLCECGCGKTTRMRRGKYNRFICGHNYRHKDSHSKIYRLWQGLKERCEQPRCPNFKNYGGRGIIICTEWRENYLIFREWVLGNGYKDGLTIDRRDNDGNYSPDNCRFVTIKMQSLNKRTNHLLTHFGETKPLTAWASDPRCVVGRNTLITRVARGWDHSIAITKERIEPSWLRTIRERG